MKASVSIPTTIAEEFNNYNKTLAILKYTVYMTTSVGAPIRNTKSLKKKWEEVFKSYSPDRVEMIISIRWLGPNDLWLIIDEALVGCLEKASENSVHGSYGLNLCPTAQLEFAEWSQFSLDIFEGIKCILKKK